jgi:hypothetical protein
MTAFEQSRIRPGDEGLANTVVDKLRGLIPAAGAISYPFWLDGFHLAVSPAGSPVSAARMLAAAFCLFAATAMPFLGMLCAFWMTRVAPSLFELRARRLTYVTIGAPPFFVLIGVGLSLLHLHVSDELVWVAAWSAAGLYVLLGGEGKPAPTVPATGSIARWRVVHGLAGAVILVYVLFHLTNHLLGLLGPDVHAAVMKAGRLVYRSPVIEPLLVALMLFQVIVGARLAWAGVHRRLMHSGFFRSGPASIWRRSFSRI